MSEPDADFKPVWVQRPVTVRALADALVTVKTFQVIFDLMRFGVFVKADTVLEDEAASKVTQRYGRKLEILEHEDP